jgi:hypothetical protein
MKPTASFRFADAKWCKRERMAPVNYWIGVVTTGEIYQMERTPRLQPYRVDVAFQPCREAPIKPLLDDLSFVAEKAHWGTALRFDQLKISAHDFALIARAMGCARLAGAAA